MSRYSPVVETLPHMLWDITSSSILELAYGLLLFSSLNIVTWSKATWLNGPLIWSSVSVVKFSYKQNKDFQRKAHKIGIACLSNTYGEEKQTVRWCVLSSLCSQVFATLVSFIFAFESFSCFPHCLRLTVSVIWTASMHQLKGMPAWKTQ